MLLVLRIVVVFYEVMQVCTKDFQLINFSTLLLRSFEYHSDYQIKSGNFMKKVQARSNSIHCKYLQGVTVGHKETLYLLQGIHVDVARKPYNLYQEQGNPYQNYMGPSETQGIPVSFVVKIITMYQLPQISRSPFCTK